MSGVFTFDVRVLIGDFVLHVGVGISDGFSLNNLVVHLIDYNDSIGQPYKWKKHN